MKRITVLFIIGAIFLSACSSSKWIRKTVIKQRDFIVTLEEYQVEGKVVPQQFDHPHEIDPAVLKAILSRMIYTEKVGIMDKEEKNSVFQKIEVDLLAPVIADTLATADANQRIRFISYNRKKGLIFSVSRETEGVIFMTPGKHLNIAFNFINSEVDPTETTAYPTPFSQVDPLKIKRSSTTIIPAAPYTHLHTFDSGEPAPMWMATDLEKLAEAAVSASMPAVQKNQETAPAALPKIEAAKTAVETSAPVPSDESKLNEDIKNKLKYLKELMDEGLISEKDYDAKKAELLNKIK